MKLPIILLSAMSLLGMGTKVNTIQPLPASAEVETPRYELPLDASKIPDDALIGSLPKANSSELGLPSKSELLDYDSINDELEFDFMGFHYRRTVNDDGTITNPVRSPITATEVSPEEVYLGPVHNSDESGTTYSNPSSYSAYVNTKTAFVYSHDYANKLDTFPNLENIIYLTYDCRLTRNFPSSLKNIYFVPVLGSNTAYFTSTSTFQPNCFKHRVNIIFPEYDKLAGIKLVNSLKNATIDNLDFVMPNFYYLDNDEAYTEYSEVIKYYEYGGFYYARTKYVGLNFTYDHVLFPGKYVTKGIMDITKVGLSALQFNIKLVGDEVHYFDELYLNMTYRYANEFPYYEGNKVYIESCPSTLSPENMTTFDEYYIFNSSSALKMNDYDQFNEGDSKIYLSTSIGQYYTENLYNQVDFDHLYSFDPSGYVKTLECRNGDKVYTSTELDYSYESSFDTILEEEDPEPVTPPGDNGNNVDNNNTTIDKESESTFTKTQKTVFSVLGILSGITTFYLIFKIIRKGIRWLKR